MAIGNTAGYRSQGTGAVAVGYLAGQTFQGTYAVAIGNTAGRGTQGANAVAIGNQAGFSTQGSGAVAIGIQAGYTNQGGNSIAIGQNAGQTNQPANSICINASNSTNINAPAASSCVIFPLRVAAATGAMMIYNITTGEVQYSSANTSATSKTFVIEHPKDSSKYLVHACLEGSESGVYYRGKGEITNSVFTTIQLPDYVDKLAGEFTIQITAIYDGKVKIYNSTEVINNEFQVFGENGRFFWHVHGKRGNIEVEPFKHQVIIKGDGPYRWIQ